ncbi:hypothetical protein GCM10009830_41720 [Glycomyces endophyticus]|uniref:ABC transporter permease n=1 Tax=Glycomyces endophyticus TaxID=480996 RepID=A0ABN2HL15_9ACTN
MNLRVRQSRYLAALLLLFFRRRVLRSGAFRSRTVRAGAAVLAALLFAVLCAAAYLFLEPLALTPELWELMFAISTVSLVLWVMGAFLVIKVLFINAADMLELSYQLPVTNRERGLAFLMYEAAITGVVVALGFSALAVTSLALMGLAAVPYLLTAFAVPALVVYLGLGVLHHLLVRLWTLLRLGGIAGLLSVIVLFLLLVWYSTTMNATIVAITDGYYDRTGAFHWQTAVASMWDRSPAVALAVSAVAVAALTAANLFLTPSQYVRQSRFLAVFTGRYAGRVLHPYDYCLVRNSQTAVAAVIAVLLFAYLLLAGNGLNPMWSLVALSTAGLYHYAGTEPLRRLPSATRSAAVVYLRLCKGQALLLVAFAVPQFLIGAFVDPVAMADSATPVLSAFAGIVLTVWISVVFPSEKNNPFSVLLGIACAAVMFGLIAIGLGMLHLPAPLTQAVLAACALVVAAHSIVEIHANESKRRNREEVPDHRGVARELPGDHPGRHRGGADAAHVLHQR